MDNVKQIISMLAIILLSGCSSSTYKMNYEYYVVVDEEGFSSLKGIVEEDNLTTVLQKVYLDERQSEDTATYCVHDQRPDPDVYQCIVKLPFYGPESCEHFVEEFNKVSDIELKPDESIDSCRNGKFYQTPDGKIMHWVLKLEGSKSETSYTIDRSVLRALSGYKGNCYSPSDIAADGSRCGKRSALYRPGGY